MAERRPPSTLLRSRGVNRDRGCDLGSGSTGVDRLNLEISIAWMVPRAGDQLEAYLLGLSRPIYGSTHVGGEPTGLGRATDRRAPASGDEFAILCPDTSLAAAAELASELREGIRTTGFAEGVTMTCSIGAAELERRDKNTETLYHRADGALYEAKVLRDTFRCAEPGTPPEERSTGPHGKVRGPSPVRQSAT